jgi:site-specific recombinase XerD
MEQSSGGVVSGTLVPVGTTASPVLSTPEALPVRDRIAFAWLMAKRTRSVNTCDRYRNDVTGWLAEDGYPVPGTPREGASFFYWADQAGVDVFVLRPAHIDGYMHWLKVNEHGTRYQGKTKLTASTRLGKLNAVRSFYKYAIANGVCETNPAAAIDGPRVDNSKSKTLGFDADQLAVIRAAARSRSPREFALIELLAATGLRISEALGSDTSDLRQESSGKWYLDVIRKGHEDKQPVQVPVSAVVALLEYIDGRQGPLFLDDQHKRMTRGAAGNRVRSIARAAMDDPSAKAHPHAFRHMVTTLLLNAQVPIRDVQVYLGHRSGETTARYDRADRARNNPAAAAMETILAGATEAQAADQ